MRNNIAIVVVTYNRINSLKRLLNSLSSAQYFEDKVTLIISVDKSENDIIENFADEYKWPFGNKIVKKHDENLGLRKHILSIGEWLDRYDAVVVLEDDIVVAESFYSYAKQTVGKYYESNEIAGISLYGFSTNYLVNQPFTPLKNIYDVYFMNCAMSWGQIWMARQWKEFIAWYQSLEEEHWAFSEEIPMQISNWKSSSWLKYHTRYCIEKNKYFVFPYNSLSTNCGDLGTHNSLQVDNTFQVPMQTGIVSYYNLPDNIDDAVLYDGFFENKRLYQFLNVPKEECCANLYGQKNVSKFHYQLTLKKLNFKIIKSFGLNYKPLEMNIIKRADGNAIYLYDMDVYSENKFNNTNLFIPYIFSIRDIPTFLRKYGICNVLKDYMGKILRRVINK